MYTFGICGREDPVRRSLPLVGLEEDKPTILDTCKR